MVPPEPKFASRMASLGLRDGQRFVVYDNSPLHSAARAGGC
jgi:thiosulfate/3-mercaptopyruvate sulfurtransferase